MNGQKRIKNLTLFLIGLSAGVISTIFPRLMTYLSASNDKIDITLFSYGYIIACVVFALIIGVSMIWIYQGTTETTRNLFMAAIALPSVLCGGINMSNTMNVSQSEITELNSKNSKLQEKLQDVMDIQTIESVSFDSPETTESGYMLPPIGVSIAYAQDINVAQNSPSSFNPSVQIQTPENRKEFVVLIKKSTSKSQLEAILNQYKKLIPNLKIKKSDNIYYLMQCIKRTKSEALLDAITIKSKYNISPKLMKIAENKQQESD